jgi:ribosomal protein L29
MEYTELTDLTDEALVHRELALERELVSARFRLHTNQLEDTSVLKKLRRDIARLQTQARDRERTQGLRRNALRDAHRSSYQPAVIAAASSDDGGGFLSGIVDKIQPSD